MNRPVNPFPGMNPFFEQVWPDIHTRLIGYLSDALNEILPDDLISRTEEALKVTTLGEEYVHRADVAVTESWRQGLAPGWSAENIDVGGITVATPVVVMGEQPVARWVEIHTAEGELVTVLELLSPSNKGSGRMDYRAKQQRILQSRVNLVEIDLLRGGDHALAVPQSLVPWRGERNTGTVCVTRDGSRTTFELYPCPLRERLPAFRFPLRATDKDIPLDLQPLINRCYETGRYWMHDFTHKLDPPPAPDDAAWVQERLRSAGLVK